MKSLRDIENTEVRKEIKKLKDIFKDSFINDSLEFIAILNFYPSKYKGEFKKGRGFFANAYFNISNCNSAIDVKCKVLEYLSRDCYKTSIGGDYTDMLFHEYMSDCVNKYFGACWQKEEFEQIYKYLGNGINRDKSIKFIESAFDFNVLEVKQ